MDSDDLDRLAGRYAELSDDDLCEAYLLGPSAYRTEEVWRIISAEYSMRGLATKDDEPTSSQAPGLNTPPVSDTMRDVETTVGMTVVYRTQMISQAESVRMALEAGGVEAVLFDELSPGYSGFAGEIRVMVRDDTDADRVEELIHGIETQVPSARVVNKSWKWQIVAILTGLSGVALLIGSAVAKASKAPPAVVVFLVVLGAAATMVGTIGVFFAPDIVKRLNRAKPNDEA